MTALHARRAEESGRVQHLLKAAHDLVFRQVHGNSLIYNACWEDPRIDREWMAIDGESKIVMITSAGCNALDYLLDGPAEIHAVDMNHRQNALLELKCAMIRDGHFEDLFQLFGIGSHEDYDAVYQRIRALLSPAARSHWDRNMSSFSPGGIRQSFYFRGAAGTAAWLLGKVLFSPNTPARMFAMRMLNARTMEEQREAYRQMEALIWGGFASWLVRQNTVMTLLGVPRPQIRLIKESHPGGLTAFVKDKLRHVMAELPACENYFWRVYVTGSYTRECCPNYLREENLSLLASRIDRVRPHTTTVANFLRQHPGIYTHYVLLDHQDWLAWHDPAALNEEWALILANSRPGTKILMRSAGVDLSFVPAGARSRLRFHEARATALHATDRVGTYGSTHFAEVL